MKIKNRKMIQALLGALSLGSVFAAKSHAALVPIDTAPPSTIPSYQNLSDIAISYGYYGICSCAYVSNSMLYFSTVSTMLYSNPADAEAACKYVVYGSWCSVSAVGYVPFPD